MAKGAQVHFMQGPAILVSKKVGGTTHQSAVKSTTTRISPVRLSSYSNSSSLLMDFTRLCVCVCACVVCVCVCVCVCVWESSCKGGWQGTCPLYFESVKMTTYSFTKGVCVWCNIHHSTKLYTTLCIKKSCCFQFMVFYLLVIRRVPTLIYAQSQAPLPSGDWLQRGQNHFHTESSPVWQLHCVACGLTCWLCKRLH